MCMYVVCIFSIKVKFDDFMIDMKVTMFYFVQDNYKYKRNLNL